MTDTPTYDEQRLRAELASWPTARRVAFAAAIAERLMYAYESFTTVAGQGDAAGLRAALDTAWRVAGGEPVADDEVNAAQESALELVPDDQDEDWMRLSPVAQNAAAAVAYALRTWLHDDPQDAVWAARQLHEAADYLVQLGAPVHTYADDATAEPMVIAVAGIDAALGAAASEPVDALRASAHADGTRFGRLLDEQPER